MMQQLLRGRIFYLALGLLIALLYAWMLRGGPPRVSHDLPMYIKVPESLADEEPSEVSTEWWPNELEFARVQDVVKRQPLLGLVLWLLSLFAVGMTLGGLALGGWALATGRIRSLWSTPARMLPRWSFGELGRVVLLVVMIAGLLPFVRIALLASQHQWSLDTHVWMTVSMLFLDLLVVLAILTFAIGKGRSLRKMFGMSSARQVGRSIRVGFRGYLAVFPWIFMLLLLIVKLAQAFHIKPPFEPIHELILQEQRPAVLALTMLLACVVGPLAEEFFFRGMLYPAIRQRSSRLTAMLASAAVFSLIHTNLLGFLPIMVLGCLLADLYERTGSLSSPLFVHVVHNSFLISLALVFRQLAPGT